MSTAFRNVLAAILVAGAATAILPGAAQAQSYPRVVGTGDNASIDYGPMAQGNLVGGGRVTVTQPNGMDVNIMHLDAMFVQQPRQGFIPLTIGSGETQETIWVPQAMVAMIRNARAGMTMR